MKLALLFVANGSQPLFSWFSSVVSGAWSVLLHRNFYEEICGVQTCLIESPVLLRQFSPPLEFGTLPSVPVSRQQVNMTWGRNVLCKYFYPHACLAQAHSSQLAQRSGVLGDTGWPQEDVPELFHSDILTLARGVHCPELCFISFSSFGALDPETCCIPFAL